MVKTIATYSNQSSKQSAHIVFLHLHWWQNLSSSGCLVPLLPLIVVLRQTLKTEEVSLIRYYSDPYFRAYFVSGIVYCFVGVCR